MTLKEVLANLAEKEHIVFFNQEDHSIRYRGKLLVEDRQIIPQTIEGMDLEPIWGDIEERLDYLFDRFYNAAPDRLNSYRKWNFLSKPFETMTYKELSDDTDKVLYGYLLEQKMMMESNTQWPFGNGWFRQLGKLIIYKSWYNNGK